MTVDLPTLATVEALCVAILLGALCVLYLQMRVD